MVGIIGVMLFTKPGLEENERAALDRDGHVLLPGRLTLEARSALIAALADIEAQAGPDQVKPRRYCAEYNDYLAGLIAHPEMIALLSFTVVLYVAAIADTIAESKRVE